MKMKNLFLVFSINFLGFYALNAQTHFAINAGIAQSKMNELKKSTVAPFFDISVHRHSVSAAIETRIYDINNIVPIRTEKEVNSFYQMGSLQTNFVVGYNFLETKRFSLGTKTGFVLARRNLSVIDMYELNTAKEVIGSQTKQNISFEKGVVLKLVGTVKILNRINLLAFSEYSYILGNVGSAKTSNKSDVLNFGIGLGYVINK